MRFFAFALALCAPLLSTEAVAEAPPADAGDPIDLQWGVQIPLRDGVKLNATLYRPRAQAQPLPCILTLTPYVAQRYHDVASYFAAHGYVFAAVDVRGRGNSEGVFTPLLQEGHDGPDVVEWLAAQRYCNGKVAMWGGSYGGYDQWATAKAKPAHLATIVPAASPKPGVDFPPNIGGINLLYDMIWISVTSGHAAQDAIFGDAAFWAAKAAQWAASHTPFAELDRFVGIPSTTFKTWIAHPIGDAYWRQYVPTPQEYAAIDLPILTITGQYDGDQPGALSFYREHLAEASAAARDKHYLVIGPWDHFGTRTPTAEYAGITFGAASVIDMKKLHKDWYDWTLKDGARPALLKDRVAYYVLGQGAEEWRYAPSLDSITASTQAWYLDSQDARANAVYASGRLGTKPAASGGKPDRYAYDPLDTQASAWDDILGDGDLTDQRGLLGADGRLLVYHAPAFAEDVEFVGFPKLSAWIAIDQPDTDIFVALYEIKADGGSVLLGTDAVRARYRKSPSEPSPVRAAAIERYDFHGFAFLARRIAKGSRLRLAIGPANSKYNEKNYNSGGVVIDESGKDARTVRVTLYHDAAHPSALYLPIAASGHSTRQSAALR